MMANVGWSVIHLAIPIKTDIRSAVSLLTSGNKIFGLTIFWLLLFGPGCNVAGVENPTVYGSLQFIVIGDWGRHGSRGQRSVAEQMNDLATSNPVDFIVSTGDNFYPNGVENVDDPCWQESFEIIYSLPALKDIPWYIALGNHDYMGNVDAQIEYGANHVNWMFPQSYHAEDFKIDRQTKVHFIFLDTNPFLEEYKRRTIFFRNLDFQDTDGQLQWLNVTLDKSDADWTIAVGHHPVYSSGYHRDTVELKNVLPALFEKYRVEAYFAGHDHHLEHSQPVGDTDYFISGGGAQVRSVSPNRQNKFAVSSLGFAHSSAR